MSYVREVNRIAKRFNKNINLDYDEEKFRFRVFIPDLVLREQKDLYLFKPIDGVGYTIEDACYNYFMKARAAYLKDIFTEKEHLII